MDTNSKEFQAALHAHIQNFVDFVQKVSPVSMTQELRICYIAQTLRDIADKMQGVGSSGNVVIPQTDVNTGDNAGGVDGVNGGDNGVIGVQEVNKGPKPEPEPAIDWSAARDCYGNLPVVGNDGKACFERINPTPSDSKPYVFHIVGEMGKFEMKPVSEENWSTIYEVQNVAFAPGAVIVDGEITTRGTCKTVESGYVKRDPINKTRWHVIKPCKVKVESL